MDAPLALYRRYRPETFAEVIGQEHVTDPLRHALAANRVNHAYLFSGPRGCGKTTSARILARALNCEQAPVSDPCGECQSCRDLARGGPGSVDVIEIDAASHGGVDDARDLRERAFFAPISSRYKVYIIDEAHMVSPQGFNALLKLVEEPPPHLKFIFATTEPDKVIGTIRSRTHHYPFRLVPPKALGDYLNQLCEAEGVRLEPAALPLVVRAGAGSVRDTLSVLDQLLGGAGPEGVTYDLAVQLLGYTPDSLLDEAVAAFGASDGATVFGVVDKIIESGQDPRRFAEDLLQRLRDLVVLRAVPDALVTGLLDVPGDRAERLQSQATSFGPADLTRMADIVNAALTEFRGATAPRLLLELMCARILVPASDASGVVARVDRLEKRLSMGGVPADQVPVDTRPAPAPSVEAAAPAPQTPARQTPAPQTPAAQSSAAQPSSPREAALRQAGAAALPPAAQPDDVVEPPDLPPWDVEEPVGRSTPPEDVRPAPSAPEPRPQQPQTPQQPQPPQQPQTPQPQEQPQQAAPAAGGMGVADVRRLWPEVLEVIKGLRRFTWIMLSQNAQVQALDGRTLTIALVNAGARDSFVASGSAEYVQQALQQVIGVQWRIEAIVDPSVDPRAASAPQPSAPAAQPAAPAPSSQGRGVGAPEAVRQAMREPGSVAPPEDPDLAAHPDDPVVDQGADPEQLLSRELGARVIDEIDHG
ncbi:DNA polymerase-3 subunit gamma/tau [Aeromicrobium sp. SORGH_AS981]|uniref:DNA polymerase III subunit gamma and tau n=2 Tax=unclassified Aeromicrobium TaxID=2633570 RepID=UPI00285FBD16|nr:DNA polymerase III subunit gamma and tau [Aeromicrobium sp. SORGH_AS_0981]MDR6118170.1 DNA polymerase-3 subunit gamma/tau [Aeromicrobium sp. SORGH_AS_0981]